jgi:multiple sugar transport system substrate-binding protein
LLVAMAAAAVVILLAAEYRGALQPPLRLMVWASPAEKEALESRLPVFSLANHGLRVQLTVCDSARDCRDRFVLQSKRGDPPDICLVSSRDLAFWVDGGHVQNLKSRSSDLDAFIPQTLAAFSRKGGLYALPSGCSVLMLYYNAALFERQGVPPPRPGWEWGDLVAAAQALTVTDETTGQTSQYGLELSPSAAVWIPWVWQNRGELFDEGGAGCLMEPRFVQSNLQAIEFYADLVRKYGVAPLPPRPGAGGDEASLFLQQKAAMTVAHRDLAALLHERVSWEWDVTPLTGGAQNSTVLDVYGYAISSQTRRSSDAWKLACFLTSENTQAAMILSGRWVPTQRSLLASRIFKDFPGPRAIQNQLFTDSLAFARSLPVVPDWEGVSAILTDEMMSLISNRALTARQSLERMQARFDELSLVRQQKKR